MKNYKTIRTLKIIARVAFIYSLFALIGGLDATQWSSGYQTSFVLLSLFVALFTDGF